MKTINKPFDMIFTIIYAFIIFCIFCLCAFKTVESYMLDLSGFNIYGAFLSSILVGFVILNTGEKSGSNFFFLLGVIGFVILGLIRYV